MSEDSSKLKLSWNSSQKKNSSHKLQSFSIGGSHKKTPFQKHKEDLELKKQKDEEETAKVFAEFVASFEEETKVPKTWVKGKTVLNANSNFKDEDKLEEKDRIYQPQMKINLKKDKDLNNNEQQNNKSKPKKRNIDSFLEEMKKEEELKSKYGKNDNNTEERTGSHDTGDPETTNLYIGNINPTVNEEMLCKKFAQYGPIASVKIMWPRTQEEKDRNRNCGFVSFMKRKDAENALKDTDGKEFMNNIMHVGWSKAVPIPPKPIYEQDSNSPTFTGHPFNAQVISAPISNLSTSSPSTQSKVRLEVQVIQPEDKELLMLIHRMIERVLKYGPDFEALIMDREWNNPKFSFLFQNNSPEHVYYRWKLYSILQGDSKYDWRTETFNMFDEGPIWCPPLVPFKDEESEQFYSDSESSSSSSDSSSDSDYNTYSRRRRRGVKRGKLTSSHRRKFQSILRNLNLERGCILNAMVFAIEHAEAADDIIAILCNSLMLKTTPMYPTKIARLYLISDILHNSSASAPNAWKYRTGFEPHLGNIIDHFNSIWKSIDARLKAEQIRQSVLAVLNTWEMWNIFTKNYINDLKERFQNDPKKEIQKENEDNNDSDNPSKRQKLENWTNSTFILNNKYLNEPNTSTLIVNENERKLKDEEDNDSVDGVPIDSNFKSGGWTRIDSNSQDEDDEDIDGEDRKSVV